MRYTFIDDCKNHPKNKSIGWADEYLNRLMVAPMFEGEKGDERFRGKLSRTTRMEYAKKVLPCLKLKHLDVFEFPVERNRDSHFRNLLKVEKRRDLFLDPCTGIAKTENCKLKSKAGADRYVDYTQILRLAKLKRGRIVIWYQDFNRLEVGKFKRLLKTKKFNLFHLLHHFSNGRMALIYSSTLPGRLRKIMARLEANIVGHEKVHQTHLISPRVSKGPA